MSGCTPPTLTCSALARPAIASLRSLLRVVHAFALAANASSSRFVSSTFTSSSRSCRSWLLTCECEWMRAGRVGPVSSSHRCRSSLLICECVCECVCNVGENKSEDVSGEG